MNQERAILLLYRSLAAEATAAELAMLQTWEAESVDNADHAQQIREVWALGGSTEPTAPVQLDVAADFDSVLSKIQARSANTHASTVATTTRRPAKSRKLRWFIAAAAAILLLVFAKAALYPTLPDLEVVTASAQQEIILPDGSLVKLNAGAKLEYPAEFSKSSRTVHLTGDAIFEVTKNPQSPFIVTNNNIEVTVLGTVFSITQQPSEVQVSVQEGSVQVAHDELKVVLAARESAIYSIATQTLEKKLDANLNDFAWSRGYLNYNDSPLQEVLSDLERYRDIEIQLMPPATGDCSVIGRYKTTDPVIDILESIGTPFDMEIKQEAQYKYILKGGSCK